MTDPLGSDQRVLPSGVMAKTRSCLATRPRSAHQSHCFENVCLQQTNLAYGLCCVATHPVLETSFEAPLLLVVESRQLSKLFAFDIRESAQGVARRMFAQKAVPMSSIPAQHY